MDILDMFLLILSSRINMKAVTAQGSSNYGYNYNSPPAAPSYTPFPQPTPSPPVLPPQAVPAPLYGSGVPSFANTPNTYNTQPTPPPFPIPYNSYNTRTTPSPFPSSQPYAPAVPPRVDDNGPSSQSYSPVSPSNSYNNVPSPQPYTPAAPLNGYNNGPSSYASGSPATLPMYPVIRRQPYSNPPNCRCDLSPYIVIPVCGNDGVTYGNICDLINAMSSTEGLGFRCGTACPCRYDPVDYRGELERPMRGSFANCLTNGTTVRSPADARTALVFDPSIGVRCDADCYVCRSGPWKCPSYYMDFTPHYANGNQPVSTPSLSTLVNGLTTAFPRPLNGYQVAATSRPISGYGAPVTSRTTARTTTTIRPAVIVIAPTPRNVTRGAPAPAPAVVVIPTAPQGVAPGPAVIVIGGQVATEATTTAIPGERVTEPGIPGEETTEPTEVETSSPSEPGDESTTEAPAEGATEPGSETTESDSSTEGPTEPSNEPTETETTSETPTEAQPSDEATVSAAPDEEVPVGESQAPTEQPLGDPSTASSEPEDTSPTEEATTPTEESDGSSTEPTSEAPDSTTENASTETSTTESVTLAAPANGTDSIEEVLAELALE